VAIGFLLAGMALVLLAFAGLVRAGSRSLAPGAQGRDKDPPGGWPRLALIVPVAGAPPGLAKRLEALLHQDYPDYQVVFATRDREDPATGVITALMQGKSRARLVVAGPTRTSGQKNWNLLAGVRLAGENPEILAFCDSNQEAPPDFLRKLAAPVALGEGVVTSGYHHIIPGDRRLATWGRAVSVLTLYLTKAVPWLNQPWGGATAIRRDIFDALRVDRLWAETVVDDVSLAALLIREHIPVCLSSGADLATPVAGETFSSWQSWLFRQWIYLKFYLPGSWLAAGAFLHLLTGLTLASTVCLLLAPWGWGTPGMILLSLSFLSGLSYLALTLRGLHPHPAAWPLWLAACLSALCLGSWVHVQTCVTQKISWRGKVYRVDWRGRIASIWSEEN
jgi:ceramide glucosyltransferase